MGKHPLFNSYGFSLTELVVTMGITVIGLMVASFIMVFGINHIILTRAEITAQENLMEAAFYLRFYLTQAVKTQCGANPGGPLPGGPYTMPTDVTPPSGVAAGLVDCRPGPVAWTLNTENPIALFVRENGFIPTGGGPPQSSFTGVGIYFTPPSASLTPAGNSGILYFAQAPPGQNLVSDTGLKIDGLVDIGVVPNSAVPAVGTAGNLQSLTFLLTARYFLNPGPQDYTLGAVNNGFVDVQMNVNIGFRNNWLGQSALGSLSDERLHGGMYYYNIGVPPLAAF